MNKTAICGKQPFIDTSKARFFRLYEIGKRPHLSEHRTLRAAERKAREKWQLHTCIGYEDTNVAVRFYHPRK